MINVAAQLSWAFAGVARLQGLALEPARLQATFAGVTDEHKPDAIALCAALDIDAPVFMDDPDRVFVPLIYGDEENGWGILVDQNPSGAWIFVQEAGQKLLSREVMDGLIFKLNFSRQKNAKQVGTFEKFFKNSMAQYRGVLGEAVLASGFISFVALAASLFSMQVYDRVIPTHSSSTLTVLAIGVGLAILLELAMKFARSHTMDMVISGLDAKLSREIFQRLLSVRVDQLPGSVGSLAGQLRGYEQLRSFYTASTLFTLVDLPLGLVFVFVIANIASPLIAAVPLLFGIVAVMMGYYSMKRVNELAKKSTAASNLKTGLLVEAVEGVETIKSGSGGWKFLSRWIDVNAESIHSDMAMRATSEHAAYLSATLQQVSYAATVVVGSWLVMDGKITMGSLIACSILGGRVLAPVTAIPGLMVQYAHSKATLEGLEKIYALQTDHHGVDRPITPERLDGNFFIEGAKFAYMGGPIAVKVDRLTVSAGERIGVLGPIGAGKSTLLRLLSGLYRPQEGRVLIDGLDIASVNRQTLNQQIGYLQQDHRLFVGTLRENLLIGMPDPGDEILRRVMERTGLIRLVAAHPKGLELPIQEGGRGLSGGQRQLVAFTRLVLCNPSTYLLDEPTASMDEELEKQCLAVLAEEVKLGKTLIVVTHKPSILPLVNRLIVVAGNQIVLDGPRDAVLARLQTPQPNAANKPVPQQSVVAAA
ncbi:ATP-binding cassette domain-containing protein [Limnohabitans sp.]|uniref:ATP-binding cassette domain-containing protein n=1 Tax=Limnohabitans sp. TaxID=1907725 RepID=UPI00286F7B87|nr:ATP-binding cassette domain-containing protein [Limnohabitans sp.]